MNSRLMILLLGVLVLAGSCVPTAIIIYNAATSDAPITQTVLDPAQKNSVSFNATAQSTSRFALVLGISTPSVQEDHDNLDAEYVGRFHFPLFYRVTDQAGTVLLNGSDEIAWKESSELTEYNEKLTSTGGTLSVKKELKKFVVPDDGQVTINFKVGADSTYEANVSSIRVELYENVIDAGDYLIASSILMAIGLIIALIGFIFVLTDSSRSKLPVNEMIIDGEVLLDEDTKQKAMLIQLSAMAGLVIPFGSIIIPLILWLLWKERHEYVDAMGREAVNFHLSMLVYYIVSSILMIVLIGFILLLVALVFHFTFVVIASIQTAKGVNYRYPLIIRFIK